MKKRIITLLAIVAVLVACMVFAVQGYEEGDVRATFKCPCATCVDIRTNPENDAYDANYTCPEESAWVTTLPTSGTLTAGHYYVNSDVQTTSTLTFPSGNTIILLDNAKLKMGFTSARMFGVNSNAKVHIVGNRTAEIWVKPYTQGSMVQMNSTGVYMHFYGSLTLKPYEDYSGTSDYGGYFKQLKGYVYFHDFGTAEGLSQDTAPTIYGMPMKSGKVGDIFYLYDDKETGTAYHPYVVLEACNLYGNSATGMFYQIGASGAGGGYVRIGANCHFVPATGSDYDLYRTLGKVQVDVDWMSKSNERFTIHAPAIGTSLDGNTAGHGQLCTNNVLEWGQLSGTTFTKDADGGDGVARDSGITLYNEEHANPPLYYIAGTSSGTAYSGFVAPRAQLFVNDQPQSWHVRPQDAFTAYNNATGEKYIKVWGDHNTKVTIDNLYVDLNGRTGGSWEVNAGKTLYLFDSKANTTTAGKTVTTSGSGTVSPITVVNNKVYAIAENTIYEVAVTAAINQAALRPTTAGMYFGAQATVTGLNAAAVAVAEANLYTGVAVATTANAEFADTAWTATQGVTGNGILVNNILKDGANNATRAGTSIYAKACVTYGGKLVALGEEKSLSMTGLMQLIAEKKPNDEGAKTFYDKWANGTGLENADSAVTAWTTNDLLAPLRAVAE